MIALDIDGTLTAELTRIPDRVVEKLRNLQKLGWRISLITGRTFSFAWPLLKQLDFPYLLALQNGADILSMPEKKLLHRSYLQADLVPQLENLYTGHPEDFIIYSGFERGDFCYFRPERFSQALLVYLYELKELSSAPWQALKEFSFAQSESFPLIKCLGNEETMLAVAGEIKKVKGMTTSVIRDPICRDLYLNLVTNSQATKGEALQFMLKLFPSPFVIAAGDDRNDLPMLACAHERIVMAGAPPEVQQAATIHAKSARDLGIIAALEEAVKRART